MEINKEFENEDSLKIQGDNYMLEKQFLKAVHKYTLALEKIEDNESNIEKKLIILSNRAEAFLKLGYFNCVLSDCDKVLSYKNILNQNLNEKINFRKARAIEQNSISIEQLEQAKIIYDSLNTKINIEYYNEKKRNLEGKFNINQLLNYEKDCFEQIKGKKYYLDGINKEYINKTYINDKIKLNFDKNKGLYYQAIDDIKIGSLILFEIPIVSVYEKEIKKYSSTFEKFKQMGMTNNLLATRILITFIKDKLKFKEEYNELIKKLSVLSNGKNNDKTIEERIKNFKINLNDENDETLDNILSNNSILTLRNEKNILEPIELCYGLYYNFSFFNHSCLPNCFHFGIANFILVKAIKDIKKGEDLTISYIEPKVLSGRKSELENWNINCECELCKIEKEICDKDNYFNIYEVFIKIQNLMTVNNIESNNDVDNKLTVDLQDNIILWITGLIEKDCFNMNDNKFKFNNFILFKVCAKIFSRFTKYESLVNYLYEKAYENIKDISIREEYDIITHWIINCKNVMYKLKMIELTNRLNKINSILFELN